MAQATSVAANTSASSGDLIIVAIQDFPVGTPAISDNLNGSYTICGTCSFLIDSGAVEITVGWVRVTAGGTPTISGDADTNRITYLRFNSFSNTATVISSDLSSGSANSGTALSSGSFNTSQNNEYAVGFYSSGSGLNGSGIGGTPSGWTLEQDSTSLLTSAYNTTGPIAISTAVSITGTLSGSNYWGAIVLGFYDASAAVPQPLISNGHPLISNGHPVISQ